MHKLILFEFNGNALFAQSLPFPRYVSATLENRRSCLEWDAANALRKHRVTSILYLQSTDLFFLALADGNTVSTPCSLPFPLDRREARYISLASDKNTPWER